MQSYFPSWEEKADLKQYKTGIFFGTHSALKLVFPSVTDTQHQMLPSQNPKNDDIQEIRLPESSSKIEIQNIYSFPIQVIHIIKQQHYNAT